MNDQVKTKAQLLGELAELRRRVSELESAEAARIHAEQALKKSEETYRQLVENLNDVIFFIDRSGIVTYISPVVESLSGYKPAEIVGHHFLEFIHPGDHAEARKRARQLLAGEEVAAGVYRVATKFGSTRFARTIWARPLSRLARKDDHVVGFTGVLADITERRRAEQTAKEYSARLEEIVEERTKELQEAQERLVRQEKLAALGRMAAGVSHELRNPLTVIGNTLYLLMSSPSDDDETIQANLNIIASEVREMEMIVSDLLDFSQVRIADRESVTLADLAARVLERHPPPERVRVVADVPANLPPVLVSSRQIVQVLSNLVTNAYQAMPEGGCLSIRATVVGDSPVAHLQVSDTGVGIAQENLGKVFEPLFTTKTRGIGLGLVISKSLVEANGGCISVESEVGTGTTFTIALSLAEDSSVRGDG